MKLQLLDFDISEDADGVVCWDALAQPLPKHNNALLEEVAQVLAWAHAFDAQGPRPLEDGGHWDFDLQVSLVRNGTPNQLVQVLYQPPDTHQAGQVSKAFNLSLIPGPGPDERIELGLSLSGTPGFCEAFQAKFGLP